VASFEGLKIPDGRYYMAVEIGFPAGDLCPASEFPFCFSVRPT
jgi:hypothetical protein